MSEQEFNERLQLYKDAIAYYGIPTAIKYLGDLEEAENYEECSILAEAIKSLGNYPLEITPELIERVNSTRKELFGMPEIDHTYFDQYKGYFGLHVEMNVTSS